MAQSQKTPDLPPTRDNVRGRGKQKKKPTNKGSKTPAATTDPVATQDSSQDLPNHVAQTETKKTKNMV
jgi:hypothetical protein